jgi:hypothetical protein
MNLKKIEREALRAMFDGCCAYCGYELGWGWCADHVEPILRKYVRNTAGHGRLVATNECYHPERDTKENLFPCCRACNIHKGASSLEGWRKELEKLAGVLRRNYPTYRHAVRFAQVSETPQPVVFWFEKCARTDGQTV